MEVEHKINHRARRDLFVAALAVMLSGFLAGSFLPQYALAAEGWEYRRKLTFDNLSQSENLTDFPVLVVLDGSRIDYDEAQDNGEDLRFFDADNTTPLAFEIEEWNKGGTSYVWVKVPQIDGSSGNDFIWMYFGNENVADGQDAENVWDSNYQGIWHLKEASGNRDDSTSNDNDGVPQNGVTQNVSGSIAGAAVFDGDDDYISVPHDSSLDMTGDLTLELWLNYDAIEPWSVFVGKGSDADDDVNYELQWQNTNPLTNLSYTDSGGSWGGGGSTTSMNAGTWYYIAVTFKSSTKQQDFYLDGSSDGSVTGSLAMDASSVGLGIGSDGAGTSVICFDGSIDEVRVSNAARSADWIAAQHASMTDGLISFGAEEELNEISGTVFEDADFDGVATDFDGGVGDNALSGVDVELYDAANAYIASTTTTGDGSFSFTVPTDGVYKVRSRSATMGDPDTPPAGGFNATVPGTWPYPLAEMTWGYGSALIGGQDPTVDDTGTGDNTGPGDNYVSLTVSGDDVTGVNLGFSYDLIVNVDDDTNADNVRSKQGTLRQFIKNSNAISGVNRSQFQVPDP